MGKTLKILAIETSCDETAMALIEAAGGLRAPRFQLLANLVSSQIKIHAPFGGVVPNLAKREHLKNLPLLWQRIQRSMNHELRIKDRFSVIHNSKSIIPAIDMIAVTVGPGLEPALWAGIEFARKKSKELGVPLIGTNHLEGHLYSFLLTPKTVISNVEYRNSKQIQKSNDENPKHVRNSNFDIVSDFGFRASDLFPAIALIVSGGHTTLLKMDSLAKWKKFGETRDDAAGEAFDKVARMLELPYPGGPEISKLAKKGNPAAIQFPRPMLHDKSFDFSFSGLKTAVLYHLRGQNSLIDANQDADKRGKNSIRVASVLPSSASVPNDSASRADVAASFQAAVVDVLTAKAMRAAKEYGARSVMLSGGVAANELLRKRLKLEARREKLDFYVAPQKFNTDNATMIAVAGYMAHLRHKKYPIKANGNLSI